MLYLPQGNARPLRVQGVLVTDEEVRKLVEFVSKQSAPCFDEELQTRLKMTAKAEIKAGEKEETLVDQCIEIIRREKLPGNVPLKVRFKLSYADAVRLLGNLEQHGIIGHSENEGLCEILIDVL